MLNNHRKNTSFNMPLFEALEGREMFSGNLPLSDALALHAQYAAPAAIVAAATKTPKLKAIVSTTGTGLTGEYFQDSSFQTGYLLRTDATVKLAPTKRDSATTQANSVRWTGQISPSYSDSYSFSVIASGGVRLWINGQLLIDQAGSTGGNFRSNVKINLVAGERYAIQMEYTRRSAPGTRVQLLWSSLHQKLGLIPQKAMFPDNTVALPATTAGLIGQYYIGKDFNQLVMQRVDPTINFLFGGTAPSSLIPAGSSFSIKWTGQIVPKYSETYTFKTNSDDGVRLYVDDELLINDWTDHAVTSDTASITLVAGQSYDIRMDYYEDHGTATAQLLWSSPSQPSQIVPSSALSSTPAATAGNLITNVISSNSIDLSWTGSASAIGYLVQQSIDGGATFTTVATTAANVLQYEVDNLDPATSYTFRIAPVGSSDTSLPSNSTLAWTATTSPSNVSATTASSTSANVSWDSVSGASGYNIYAAPVPSTQTDAVHTQSLSPADIAAPSFQQIGTVGADTTSFVATNLTPGTQYQFMVRSLNAVGTLSNLSNTAAATTLELPPGTLTAVPSVNSVSLIWTNVPNQTGYAIDRSSTGTDGWNQITTTDGNLLTYTDTNVLPRTTYFYRIRSLNTGGSSDPSTPIQTTTLLSSPASLTNGAVTALGTVLNWADVTGETGFVVLESTDGGNTFSQIAITPAGITSFPVTGLTANTPYQFEVEALNAATIPSAPSSSTSLVTTTAAPPSLLATAVSTSQANLSWSDVAGETGFTVQRSPDGITGWSTVATLPASVLTYTDTALSPGTNYFYQVTATNAGGTSSPSVTAAALTIPAAPVATLTGLSTAQSQVSWNAVNGASQYVIQRSTNGTSGWTTAATATGSSLSATVANLAASTLYYYRVAAVNATGTSAQSSVVSQTSAPLAQYALQNVIYGTTAAGGVYSVDVTNGTYQTIGQLTVIPQAATRDPFTGMMYFFQQGTSNIYSWDPNTGNTLLVDTSIIGSTIVRGAYAADGTGYTIAADDNLRSVAPGSPTSVVIGQVKLAGVALPTTAGSMAFSSSGQLFMVIGANLYTLNTSTAAATLVGTTSITGNPAIVFGPKGILYSTTGSGGLMSVNLTSAVSTLLGNDNLPSFTSLAAVPTFTDLSVTATASPTAFTKGQNATYTVNVTNTTGDATSQPITVTTTLTTGLSFSSVAGTGWTATVSGQIVTLTYAAGAAVNGALPTVNLVVAVSSSAPSIVTTSFSVSSNQLDANPIPTPAVVVSAAV